MRVVQENNPIPHEPGVLGKLKELPRSFPELEVSQLAHREPINEANVAAKKESLLQNGQLQPLGVGIYDSEILGIFDGLNRQRAMEELGIKTAHCELVEMTPEQFRDARIASTAEQHPSLEFARIVNLVRESFRETKFSESIDAFEAFTSKGFPSSRLTIFNPRQLAELEKWVADKSKAWAIDREKIAQWLRIADLVTAPELISQVRDIKDRGPEFLTTEKLWMIAETVSNPILQRAFVAKVKAEKLGEAETIGLMFEVNHASPEETDRLLHTNWVEIERESDLIEQQEKSAQAKAFEQELEKRYQENWPRNQIEAVIRGIRFATEDLPELNFEKYPDLAELFNNSVNDLITAVSEVLGGPQNPNARLGKENKRLRFENNELKKRVEQLERLAGLRDKIHQRDLKSRDAVD